MSCTIQPGSLKTPGSIKGSTSGVIRNINHGFAGQASVVRRWWGTPPVAKSIYIKAIGSFYCGYSGNVTTGANFTWSNSFSDALDGNRGNADVHHPYVLKPVWDASQYRDTAGYMVGEIYIVFSDGSRKLVSQCVSEGNTVNVISKWVATYSGGGTFYVWASVCGQSNYDNWVWNNYKFIGANQPTSSDFICGAGVVGNTVTSDNSYVEAKHAIDYITYNGTNLFDVSTGLD